MVITTRDANIVYTALDTLDMAGIFLLSENKGDTIFMLLKFRSYISRAVHGFWASKALNCSKEELLAAIDSVIRDIESE